LKDLSLEPMPAELREKIGEQMQTILDTRYREVSERAKRCRETAQRRHNHRINSTPYGAQHRKEKAIAEQMNYAGIFMPGVFVLVASVSPHSKLTGTWQGPCRVLDEISPWVYTVQHLVTQKKETVHICRLRYYCDSGLQVTTSLLNQISYNQARWEIETLLDLKEKDQEICVQVKWLGFPSDENTWEPIEQIALDVPRMCEEFLDRSPQKELAKRARASLSGAAQEAVSNSAVSYGRALKQKQHKAPSAIRKQRARKRR
jgi:hypothetical protein